MPAYNFQKQFAPAVERGDKLCTIRRKAPNVGDKAYLYTGMRTKACRPLGVGVVTKVTPFSIRELATIRTQGSTEVQGLISAELGDQRLTLTHLNDLALKDGFESADAFASFFKIIYGGNFDGHLIEWEKQA